VNSYKTCVICSLQWEQRFIPWSLTKLYWLLTTRNFLRSCENNALKQSNAWVFVARRSALARHLLRQRCLYVCHVPGCLSDTLKYCAQTTESIITRPSPIYSQAILAFLYQIRTRWLEGYVKVAKSGQSGVGQLVSDSWAAWVSCCIGRQPIPNTAGSNRKTFLHIDLWFHFFQN